MSIPLLAGAQQTGGGAGRKGVRGGGDAEFCQRGGLRHRQAEREGR